MLKPLCPSSPVASAFALRRLQEIKPKRFPEGGGLEIANRHSKFTC